MILRLLIILFALFAFVPNGYAEEVIHDFTVNIEIQESGDIKVSENITVRAEGNKIKRGIFRDLPKYREAADGRRMPMKYKILSITRDGQPENYFKERHTYYNRYYLGEESYFLPTGRTYNYQINYLVSKQVFFYDDFDELNWNVTGNDWDFPIEKAQLYITAPPHINVQDYAAYTGYVGEKGLAFEGSMNKNRLHVQTTELLRAGEGLTVATIFPKGFFDYPSALEKFFAKYSGFIILFGGLGICGVYYMHTWRKYGKDPRSRGLAPFYDPPENISPALAHYIMGMGGANKKDILTITIVSLASKGYLTIEQNDKKKFVITKRAKKAGNDLSTEEMLVYTGLSQSVTIKPHDSTLISLVNTVQESVEEQEGGNYFKLYTKIWALGLVPFIATFIVMLMNHDVNAEFIILLIVNCFAVFFIFALIRAGVKLVKGLRGLAQFRIIINIFLVGYFVVSVLPALFMFMAQTEWSLPLIIPSVIGFIFIMFMFHWMKAPTVMGQEVMDHLRGLQLYMEKVEEPILQKFDPPQMSRELFEKFLPYAVALEVDSKWADAFAKHAQSAMSEETSHSSISPSWYRSSSSGFSGKDFTTGALIGGLGSALSTASSVRSSSSSGGSGFSGGSSGGGGGGGGGGGW